MFPSTTYFLRLVPFASFVTIAETAGNWNESHTGAHATGLSGAPFSSSYSNISTLATSAQANDTSAPSLTLNASARECSQSWRSWSAAFISNLYITAEVTSTHTWTYYNMTASITTYVSRSTHRSYLLI